MLEAPSKTLSSSGQPPFTTTVSIPLFWRRHFSSTSVPALNSCWPGPWLGLPATSTILMGGAAKADAATSRIKRILYVGCWMLVAGCASRGVFDQHLTSNIQNLSFHAQQPSRVVVVDLAQNRIRQSQAGNAPAALGRLLGGRIVEVFVFGLEEAVVDFVEALTEDLLRRFDAFGDSVGAEQDTVLILVEELSRAAGLAAQLADAGAELDAHVRVAVHGLRDVGQILRVPHLQYDELSARIALDQAQASVLHFAGSGKIFAIERPFGVRVQFFVTLIEAVDRQEKGFRIGGAVGDWHLVCRGGLPHGVEARVVGLVQLAGSG